MAHKQCSICYFSFAPGLPTLHALPPPVPSSMFKPFSFRRQHQVLPGFGLTLGFTIAYLSLIVLLPLSAVLLKTLTMTFAQFWDAVTAPRVLASYKLSFGMSLLAA